MWVEKELIFFLIESDKNPYTIYYSIEQAINEKKLLS